MATPTKTIAANAAIEREFASLTQGVYEQQSSTRQRRPVRGQSADASLCKFARAGKHTLGLCEIWHQGLVTPVPRPIKIFGVSSVPYAQIQRSTSTKHTPSTLQQLPPGLTSRPSCFRIGVVKIDCRQSGLRLGAEAPVVARSHHLGVVMSQVSAHTCAVGRQFNVVLKVCVA